MSYGFSLESLRGVRLQLEVPAFLFRLLGWLLPICRLSLLSRLHRLFQSFTAQVLVQVFVATVYVRCVSDAQAVLPAEFLQRVKACLVVIQETVDAFIVT